MLLDRFLPRIEFDSYEDFKKNYKVNVPEDFNFGFDIVDVWADSEPEKRALVMEALKAAGREDLIGYSKKCLIQPDKGAVKNGGIGNRPGLRDSRVRAGKKRRK